MPEETNVILPDDAAKEAQAKAGPGLEEFLNSDKRPAEVVGGGIGAENGQARVLLMLSEATDAALPKDFGGVATITGRIAPDAIASSDLDRVLHWTGRVDGWRQFARVGELVRKTGCTSNYTQGRVVAVNAMMDVGPYAGGGTARFHDRILTTQMTVPGDSGSLMVALDLPAPSHAALGLLFASSVPGAVHPVPVANRIENVRELLRVEIGEGLL